MSSNPQAKTAPSGETDPSHQSSPKTFSKPTQTHNKRHENPAGPPFQQKVSRRSSKPIINWFQRKLAGSGKMKRHDSGRQEMGKGRPSGLTSPRVSARAVSSPVPATSQRASGGRQSARSNTQGARRKTISLNEDNLFPDEDDYVTSDDSSSVARGSAWSPTSALEADEDASLRPLPPSAPPSPSPSRSSSSYLSDPRTFRSMAASTKPTTVLSIDLTPGVAHIAQVAASPQIPRIIPPHVRNGSSSNAPGFIGSGASITFSALPPSPQSSSGPSSFRDFENTSTTNQALRRPTTGTFSNVLQAPLHTSHHPRNNPRPSSPPLDNASVLTLASSAFGIPGARLPTGMGWVSTSPSTRAYGDSVSHFGGSAIGEGYLDPENASQLLLGDDDRQEERDTGASLRALRPRSSRRGSWESDQASVWSAKGGAGGSTLARELSGAWTSNSARGGFLASEEIGEHAEDSTDHESTEVVSSNTPDSLPPTRSHSDHHSQDVALEVKEEKGVWESMLTKPALDPKKPEARTVSTFTEARTAAPEVDAETPVEQDDSQSVLVEIWHSAPSTPLPLQSAGLQGGFLSN